MMFPIDERPSSANSVPPVASVGPASEVGSTLPLNRTNITRERAYLWPLLQAYVKGLIDLRPEITEVRVFGRFLEYSSHLEQEIELLLVLSRSPLPMAERARYYPGPTFHAAVALYPMTQKEINRELNQGNTVLRRILSHSRVIYRQDKKRFRWW